MEKRIVHTKKAPQPIGPYSQAVFAGNFLFVSGQVPIEAESGQVSLFDGDITQQTDLVLRNLQAILEAADLSLNNVVKTTIYLTDMAKFKAVNQVYEQFFGEAKPARATVAVAALPAGVEVEIDAIAIAGS